MPPPLGRLQPTVLNTKRDWRELERLQHAAARNHLLDAKP